MNPENFTVTTINISMEEFSQIFRISKVIPFYYSVTALRCYSKNIFIDVSMPLRTHPIIIFINQLIAS